MAVVSGYRPQLSVKVNGPVSSKVLKFCKIDPRTKSLANVNIGHFKNLGPGNMEKLRVASLERKKKKILRVPRLYASLLFCILKTHFVLIAATQVCFNSVVYC